VKEVAKTSETLSIDIMLERIRNKHIDIDIIPLIQEELNNILPQYIEEIIKNTYVNIAEDNNE
jgi:hypothetical protein